jgi:hypothetical protein
MCLNHLFNRKCYPFFANLLRGPCSSAFMTLTNHTNDCFMTVSIFEVVRFVSVSQKLTNKCSSSTMTFVSVRVNGRTIALGRTARPPSASCAGTPLRQNPRPRIIVRKSFPINPDVEVERSQDDCNDHTQESLLYWCVIVSIDRQGYAILPLFIAHRRRLQSRNL